MKDVLKVIEALRSQLDRHKHSGLKEYPTRSIFTAPLVSALGWDIRDPDEVQLEYATVNGKSGCKDPLEEDGIPALTAPPVPYP